MYQLLKLSNMGTKGINTDIDAWELPPEFITDGINFSVVNNKLASVQGNKSISNPPTNHNLGHLRFVSGDTDYWVLLNDHSVWAYDGKMWYDITGVLFDEVSIPPDNFVQFLYTSCLLGKIPIFNNPLNYPSYWWPADGLTPIKHLDFTPGKTWGELNKSCRVMRVYKNFLFALNLTEDAVHYPDTYRWSHPADINGLPYTWDEQDLSSIAGRSALGGDSGEIIDGMQLRDSFIIYSENAINVIDFSGGEFVFSRRVMTTSVNALLSMNCVVEVQGVHYFIVSGDIMINDGANVSSIANKIIRKLLTTNINPEYTYTAFAVHHKLRNEVWFCVCESETVDPDTAYVYNYIDSTWAVRKFINPVSYADFGTITTEHETYDNDEGSFDEAGDTYDTYTEGSVVGQLVAPCNTTVTIDNIDPLNGNKPIYSFIERTNYPLIDHRAVNTIVRAYPHIKGSKVYIQIGAHEYNGAPVNWKPPVLFDPDKDRKVDVRATGELHAWRIYSEDVSPWTISGIDFEYTTAGLR